MATGRVAVAFNLNEPEAKTRYDFLNMLGNNRSRLVSMLLDRYLEEKGVASLEGLNFSELVDLKEQVRTDCNGNGHKTKTVRAEVKTAPKVSEKVVPKPEIRAAEEQVEDESEEQPPQINESLIGELSAFF